ncbi:MAG: FAD-binding oxidoreductase [Gammaproteobacteria bacterium]|nr:FAD-binding oxidoreductase [Gammaproteobacteria bacterium]
MDRRTLIKLLAAMSVSGCGTLNNTAKGLRVVVAGAGIIGASIAYHLAKSGAKVTIIDKQGPATHATGGSFAWINATWAKQPQHYHALTQSSVANWHGLQQDLNLDIRWQGSLEWYDSDKRTAKLVEQIAEQQAWGERARMVDTNELAELEPEVEFGNAKLAAFSENDGAIDPVVTTKKMLTAARAMGAKIQYPCELVDVSLKSGRLVEVTTSLGTIKADRLVLATGAELDAGKQFADFNIPQRSTPGIIVTTAPMPRLINRIISAPGAHLHQRNDGRIVIGEQAGVPQNEAHAQRLKNRPNRHPDKKIAMQHASRILDSSATFVPRISAATIDDVRIGWRPLPLDGHPVIGPSRARPDVYFAIMHSGVSLAPIVGQLAVHELANATVIKRLDEYRPGREFVRIKRY